MGTAERAEVEDVDELLQRGVANPGAAATPPCWPPLPICSPPRAHVHRGPGRA
jgi:hypothetical protein